MATGCNRCLSTHCIPSPSSLTNPLLSLFWASSIFMIINYGGVYSVAPAYIADLYGQKNVGPIFGKMLTGTQHAPTPLPCTMPTGHGSHGRNQGTHNSASCSTSPWCMHRICGRYRLVMLSKLPHTHLRTLSSPLEIFPVKFFS